MPTTTTQRQPAATRLAWKGRLRRAGIPPTRDPFINSLMTLLAPDAGGAERFFISTCNTVSGSLGACVNEHGRHRIYHFNKPLYGVFYSAAQEDDDTLWLCSTLDKVVRFSLSTGKTEAFDTGAPSVFVFQGLALDKATGKLAAFAFPGPRTMGFVFDYRNRKPVKVVEQPLGTGYYMRRSVLNPDGTWSIIMHMPGEHLFIWDPRTDQFDSVTIAPKREAEDRTATSYMAVFDDDGRMYYPRIGWYDWRTRRISTDGPRPKTEMTWFGRIGRHAVGLSVVQGATATLGRWDMQTGDVESIATVQNCFVQNVNLTKSGKIVGVTVYGEFFRLDAMTGALEGTRVLDATGINYIDTLCLIDKDRLLGTPFITQRFWEVNLKTGKGADMGRAASGVGEIMQLTKVGDKVYMGAYTGGELVEYDPARPSRFPENPRVVADPPVGMRPVAMVNDGRCVYYSCSRDYGKLGSILTRYDTRTGLATYAPDPLGHRMIDSLCYDKATRSLLCGSTINAEACPPTEKIGQFARIDAASLKVLERGPTPEGYDGAVIYGPLGSGQWLAGVGQPYAGGKWFTFRPDSLATPGPVDLRPWPGEGVCTVLSTGRAGKFLLCGTRLEVWDLRKLRLVRSLPTAGAHLLKLVVQGDDVLFTSPKEVFVLPGALKGI